VSWTDFERANRVLTAVFGMLCAVVAIQRGDTLLAVAAVVILVSTLR
jgi:hypothetical protein